MWTWLRKHPIAGALLCAVLTLAAIGCAVLHYLDSWLVLPLL